MDDQRTKQLVELMQVLADEERLEILRLLHEREYSVSDLAVKINLTDARVTQHLNCLREAWLLSLRMDGSRRLYRANHDGLATFKALVADIEKRPGVVTFDAGSLWIAELGWDAAEQQVLRDFTRGGCLTCYPEDYDQQDVILKWLATLFEANRMYSEPEVNAILMDKYAPDYVSLRRDLVDMRLLGRDRGGRTYWRMVEELA